MATKLNNFHLSKIMECKEYKLLDTYICLSYAALETKSGLFIIQTCSSKFSDLINVIKKYVNCSYKTAYNCINTLKSLNILSYNEDLSGWILLDMESMFRAKKQDNPEEDSLYGYTNIRNLFLTPTFYNMRAREKRLVVYLCQLADSKNAQHYKDFSINLLKSGNKWMHILQTNCKYYAKETIENLFKKYPQLFIDNSAEIRSNTLAPKQITRFKFLFTADELKNDNEEDLSKLLKENNSKEYNLVLDKIKFAKITLSKQKIAHIVRGISNLRQWFLKERIVQLIINKYIAIQVHRSREDIKSLPAYTAAVVKNVVAEYKNFSNNTKLTSNLEKALAFLYAAPNDLII